MQALRLATYGVHTVSKISGAPSGAAGSSRLPLGARRCSPHLAGPHSAGSARLLRWSLHPSARRSCAREGRLGIMASAGEAAGPWTTVGTLPRGGEEADGTCGVSEESAAAEGAAGSAGRGAASVIDFLTIVTRLKDQKRTGWVLRHVRGPESIADHMYRMGVMAMLLGDRPGLNRDRCVRMALAHDIAEAIVGDIAPADGISKEEKRRREAAAIDDMCRVLGGSAAAEVRELWEEYEANSTPEARVVKDLDKVEMILQAHEYEQAQGMSLQDFFDSTKGKFQTEIGQSWAAEIVARRQNAL